MSTAERKNGDLDDCRDRKLSYQGGMQLLSTTTSTGTDAAATVIRQKNKIINAHIIRGKAEKVPRKNPTASCDLLNTAHALASCLKKRLIQGCLLLANTLPAA
jgi:hypothetical protein